MTPPKILSFYRREQRVYNEISEDLSYSIINGPHILTLEDAAAVGGALGTGIGEDEAA